MPQLQKFYFTVGSAQHGMMMNQSGMQQMAGQPRMMIRNIGQQPPAGNLRQVNILESQVSKN